MRIAYADPPYIGQAKLYRDHPDYAGEVDHAELARTLSTYDGFVLHLSSPTLYEIETYLRSAGIVGYRVCQWVKTFAAFKRNVSVAYAYEPVIILPARKPVVRKSLGVVYRDWIAEPITLKKGLTGVKPERVCRWAFALSGAEAEDYLDDMFPGTYAVTRAWDGWRADLRSLQDRAGGVRGTDSITYDSDLAAGARPSGGVEGERTIGVPKPSIGTAKPTDHASSSAAILSSLPGEAA